MERVVAKGGFCVFTDGSGFKGGVGAAAVVMRREKVGEQRQKYLRLDSEHTIFKSEVCGAIFTLDIIASTPCLTDINIFMDCQPPITVLASPKSQPGQYLLTTFYVLLARLLCVHHTLKLRLHWVPAHIGIKGNEVVDICAKAAAQGVSFPLLSRIWLFE
jgi:ribonuclease HI